MLRSAFDDYLTKLRERELDFPFLQLLPAMGFYDVHLTHGAVEYGKDFIAKRIEDGEEIQYSFQNKVGNINQKTFRDDILGQLREAIDVPIGHANFNIELPQQVVLVTTGDLIGNAGNGLKAFNEKLTREGKRPVQFWGKGNLIDSFLEYGLEGATHATAHQYEEYGSFFVHFGRALEDRLSARELELYSRIWLQPGPNPISQRLRIALEAEILSQALLSNDRLYESIVVRLATIRTLCVQSYSSPREELTSAYNQALIALRQSTAKYLTEFREIWEPKQDLVGAGIGSIATYRVHCSRVLEIAGIAYFSTDDATERLEIAEFLERFCLKEDGTAQPISDWYAISIVSAALALRDAGKTTALVELIRRATIWLCERFEKGAGLAGLAASETDELTVLLGESLSAFNVERSRSSFLATVVCDMAAILVGESLYDNVINDVLATDINPVAVQPIDTAGSCEVSSRDVVQFPTVQYVEKLASASGICFANYLETEGNDFEFIRAFGSFPVVALMALLRDRYYPLLLPRVVSGIAIPC